MFNTMRCSIPRDITWKQDKKNTHFIQTVLEEKRRTKELHEKEFQMTAENPRIRNQEETTDISLEMRLQKLENIVKEKRRQQLRENSHELRLLLNRLETAGVAKQLVEQKVELQNKKYEDFRNKRKEDTEIEVERLRIKDITLEQDIKQQKKKTKFRSELQNQMEEMRALRQQQHNEVKREHRDMQKLQRHLEENRIVKLEEMKWEKLRAKNDIENFLRSQKKFKVQFNLTNNENIICAETCFLCDEKQLQAQNSKQQTIRKQTLSERMGWQLFVVENEKRRREDQLLDLLVEERKAKEDQRFRLNISKQAEERINIRLEMEQYQKNNVRYKKERQDENGNLRNEQIRLLTEYNKLENIAREHRKHKRQEHGRVMQQIIEEKRNQVAMNATEMLREYDLRLNREHIKDQEIQEERLRLLSQQPIELLRFLPKNVLRECDRIFVDKVLFKSN